VQGITPKERRSTMENDESTLKDKGKEDAGIYLKPLREIRLIRNWCEWLFLWQKAETLEEMLGLLHVGFNVSLKYHWKFDDKEYDEFDRLISYFTIADGWRDKSLLQLPEDKGKNFRIHDYENAVVMTAGTPSDLRQLVARKAFNMLCLNFFRRMKLERQHRGKYNHEWEELVVSGQFFLVIQKFFAAEEARVGRDIEIRNLSRLDGQRSNNERQAVNFLLNLAEFLWGWREEDLLQYCSDENAIKKYEEYSANVRTHIDAAKPWMIEVLNFLNRLDILQPWIIELNDECLIKLKEISFRNTELSKFIHPISESRPVATLNEACYVGSNAAWLLKKHELKTIVHTRLKGIQEAEEKIAEANSRIKDLAG